MDDFIQSKVDKAVPFHDPLKRLNLKSFASDGVIKMDNVKTFSLLFYYVKLHPLIGSAVAQCLSA